MSNSKLFRTRQAPSPTGYLHLGTARTVLFTKLFSLINSGQWYLRLEDTDRNRLQSAAVKNLLSCLEKLGLEAQEGIKLTPDSNENVRFEEFYEIYESGDFGPYIQSKRLSLYHHHAQNLINQRLAYWSYLSPQEKEDLQAIKQANKQPINYFYQNLSKNPLVKDLNLGLQELEKIVCGDDQILYQSVEKGLNDERKPVLMYRLQRPEKVECFDELLGKSEFDLRLEEDFVILKSDGFPTYHLAHLVDDHLMETTLVVRAQEWFPSIAKHITMFRDYWAKQPLDLSKESFFVESKNGHNVPAYLHLPFILGELGNKKMSKRDGNVNVQDYLDKGYLPEAIVNYLAFLGWNPGTDKELYLSAEDFNS